MSVKIRLARMGRKKTPYYRIVVAESTAPRDGRYIEVVGSYDPRKDPAITKVKEDRIAEWLSKGAKPTVTVSSLLKKKGLTHQVRKD